MCALLGVAIGGAIASPLLRSKGLSLLTFKKNYKLILSNRTLKLFNKAVMQLLTIFNRTVMGYSWCIRID